MAYKVGDEVRFHTGARLVLTKVDYNYDEFEGKTDQGTILKFPGKFIQGHIKDEPIEVTSVLDSAHDAHQQRVAEVCEPIITRGAGLKYDAGKPQARLVFEGFPLLFSGLTDVLTMGAAKYSAHSWQHVENGIDRYSDAAGRHMLKRLSGEQHDDESGLDHELHELINRMFVMELKLRERRGTD